MGETHRDLWTCQLSKKELRLQYYFDFRIWQVHESLWVSPKDSQDLLPGLANKSRKTLRENHILMFGPGPVPCRRASRAKRGERGGYHNSGHHGASTSSLGRRAQPFPVWPDSEILLLTVMPCFFTLAKSGDDMLSVLMSCHL